MEPSATAQEDPISDPGRRVAEGLLAWLRRRLDVPRLGYRSAPRPIPGGTETGAGTWRFQLSGASAELRGPLALRVYSFAMGDSRAIRESGILASLAETGYPVPRVHLTCTDSSVLGGAFFVMRFLPGETLARAPAGTIPGLLSRAHVALHRIETAPFIEALRRHQVVLTPQRPSQDLSHLAGHARQFPRLRPLLDWMWDHLPPAPGRLSICHGDFHPLNVVVNNGEIAGVLDWPNVALADAALDVGSTMTLSIPARHLATPPPHPRLWDRYLECYRRESDIDSASLDYYRTRRGLVGLLAGAKFRGRKIWRNPAILRDLLEDLRQRTGVAISTPPWDP